MPCQKWKVVFVEVMLSAANLIAICETGNGLLRVAQFGHKTRQKLRDAELALRTPSMLLSCSFKVKAGKTELHIRSCPKDCMKSRCGDFPLTFLERRHISGANGAVLA